MLQTPIPSGDGVVTSLLLVPREKLLRDVVVVCDGKPRLAPWTESSIVVFKIGCRSCSVAGTVSDRDGGRDRGLNHSLDPSRPLAEDSTIIITPIRPALSPRKHTTGHGDVTHHSCYCRGRGVARTISLTLDLDIVVVLGLDAAFLAGRAVLLDRSVVLVGLLLLGRGATTLALLGSGSLDVVIGTAALGSLALARSRRIDIVRLEKTLVPLGAGGGGGC